MQCQHLLVEVERRRCTRQASVKVMEVSPSFLDVQRRAIRVEHAMSGNYCLRTQSLDRIQRAQPLTSGLFVALREIRVGIVVDRIPEITKQIEGTCSAVV